MTKFFNKIKSFYQRHKKLTLSFFAFFGLVLALLSYEFRTSRLQSYYFSDVGEHLTFKLKPGASNNIRFPDEGPHDIRLGYTRIASIIKNLAKEGYFVEAQAEISNKLAELVDKGIFPIYHEKTQAGLKVVDKNGATIYSVSRPEHIFSSFKKIPPIIVSTILFIENREILDPNYPYKNPAVEWDRLFLAFYEKFVQIFNPDRSAPGGSTIATQLEKYLHGDEGRTRGVKDKFRQMLSASYRAYLDGAKTFMARERIVLNYINSIPLAALPGYGEVNGLLDGMSEWYGVNPDDANKLLMNYTYDSAKIYAKEYATTYKQILSLFIAHRRPSYYLLTDSNVINGLADEYLHILTAYEIIPPQLRDAALKVKLKLMKSAAPPVPISFIERKAANAVRTQLLKIMQFKQLYDLDHVDLSVNSVLDSITNNAVAKILLSLKDPKSVAKYGLLDARTLDKGDPSKVIYSVTLYERSKNVNLLRIQTDNLDRPFDINEGTRLDLGSTAKLRVLSNYLGIIANLHQEYSAYDKEKIAKLAGDKLDPLSKWVAEQMKANSQIQLQDLLDAAMLRQYSASPGEQFFTGGGLHTFSNFKKEDNSRTVTVQEALRNSINLPFIRIIRDCLKYYMAEISGENAGAGKNEAKRQAYLAKFADKEGSLFIQNFYQKYRGKSPSEILGIFLKGRGRSARTLAVIFRHLKPTQNIDAFKEFLGFHWNQPTLSDKVILAAFDAAAPGKYSLNDQGYIARVHPLELWLVGYMINHPKATFTEIIDASKNERQEVYQWLMTKRNQNAQNSRIHSIIEAEAFLEMHKAWRRLGYPFQSMVPSLASAIGNSGDRPAALAELMGIIVNDGVRYPMQRMEQLHFAAGTPFETILSLNQDPNGDRVMKKEVAVVLRKALRDVVENGTARRVDKAFKNKKGEAYAIGGKTGTGDNRYETFGKGGQLTSSRVVNRTATFVFYIGDRFFGTVTAHVEGPQAANYDFTSALAAQLLKGLAPEIQPLINGEAATPTPLATVPALASPEKVATIKPVAQAKPSAVPTKQVIAKATATTIKKITAKAAATPIPGKTPTVKVVGTKA